MVSKAVPPTPGSKYRIKVGQTIGGLVWSNVAYTVDGKWQIIYDDGEPDMWPIVQSASGSSRAAVLWTTGQIAKKNGWVIGGVVFGAAASQRGQSYVQAFVLDANYTPASITDYLAMGYAYASKPVEFGTFVEPGPAGGHGNTRTLTLAQPGAGADFATQTVPTGSVWKHRGFFGQLITSATAANREVTFRYFDPSSNAIAGSVASEIQTATLTDDYLGIGISATSAGVSVGLAGGVIVIGIGDLILLAAGAITHKTYNIQGTDQWTGSGFDEVEEWVMPN